MRHLALVAVLLLAALAAAEDAPPQLAALAPAMAAGEPEAVLPGQALIHVRLNKLDATLDALDGMLAATVPEAAIPPQALAAFSPPKKMLSLLAGLASQGRAPAIPALIILSGIDVERPITLTIYPQAFPRSWVVSLPIKDAAALGNLLMGAFQPIACEPMQANGKNFWHIQGSNPSLPPEVFLMRSPDRVYLVSPSAGESIFSPATTLASDPVVGALPPGDLAIALCAAPLKQALPMLAMQAAHFDQRTFAPLGEDLRSSIGKPAIDMINAQMPQFIGVDGLDQLLDYADCLLQATVKTVGPQLAEALKGFDGIGIGLELAPGGLALRVDVHAAGIEGFARDPLPQTASIAALGGVRFTPMCVSMLGRQRAEAASPLLEAWSQAVTATLAQHGLKPGIIGACMSYLREVRRVPTLHDAAPWALAAQGAAPAVVPAQRSLKAWWSSALKTMGADATVTVLPLPGPEPLIAHLSAAAATANANIGSWNQRMQPYLGEGWIVADERFHADTPAGKPMRLVRESCYTTRSGLFGCSEHELINRVIWECQERSGMLVLQQAVGEQPTALASAVAAPTAVPAALERLARLIQPGCDQAMIMRMSPALPELVDNLIAAETSLHNEIDDYLQQARAVVAAHPGDVEAARAEIAKLPMPELVGSLSCTEQGEVGCKLAGRLAYPRPLISGVIKDLLAGPLAHADEDGGMCLTSRSQPGLCSFSAQVDLRACERLVHDAGNAIATRFLAQPNPQRALAEAIGTPGDGGREAGEILAVNPMWAF